MPAKKRTAETSPRPDTKSKKAKNSTSAGEEQAEEFWEISGKRRVAIQRFGGKVLVGIREYYGGEGGGGMLPSKKGISLPVEQFNALIRVLPQIEASLAAQGQKIERPDYEGVGVVAAGDGGGDGDGEKVEEPEVEGKAKAKAKEKRNFEETSDEEE